LIFALLVFYVVKLLNRVEKTLDTVDQAIHQLNYRMEQAAGDSRKLLLRGEDLIAELQQKSEQTDALFSTVDDVGKFFRGTTTDKGSKPYANLLAVVHAGIDVYKYSKLIQNVKGR
jgi:uncharacterized protein YoxC